MSELPPPLPGTALRILATSDLGAAAVPMRTSHGLAGTCAGVAALLERERERVPVEWFDVGDLVVGNPAFVLTGERPWEDVARLPIAVTTAGNHEFDDGLDALQSAAARLSYPMLCANADVRLAATAMVGDVGMIGLTHLRCPDLSRCPVLRDDGDFRVTELARELRRDGARWIVVLLHDGVTFWPGAHDGVETRSAYLKSIARPWAAAADLILCGPTSPPGRGSSPGRRRASHTCSRPASSSSISESWRTCAASSACRPCLHRCRRRRPRRGGRRRSPGRLAARPVAGPHRCAALPPTPARRCLACCHRRRRRPRRPQLPRHPGAGRR